MHRCWRWRPSPPGDLRRTRPACDPDYARQERDENGYNEANLLEAIEVNLRGEKENGERKWTPFVKDIDYDAKGQRTRIEYGNNVTTTYAYDAEPSA